MKIKGFQNGYNAAIEALKAALRGEQQSGPAGSGAQSDPLPSLPIDNKGQSQGQGGQDKKDNPSNQNNKNGQGSDNQGSGRDRSKDDSKSGGGKIGKLDNKTLSEVESADTNATGGGWISQEAGAKLAERAGYDKEDCKTESISSIANSWREAAVEACSQQHGSGAGNILTAFDKLYKTTHDWKAELRRYMGKALSKVETDTKMGRKKPLATRGELRKYTIPGERDLDQVIYCIDTSGSVSDSLLKRLVSECYTISCKKGVDVATYVMFDDGVQDVVTVKGKKMPDFKLKGRGGTNFEVLFNELDKRFGKKKCPLVMVFTDGYCDPVPARKKWMDNVIWVAYDNQTFGKNFGKSNPDRNTKVIYMSTSDIN